MTTRWSDGSGLLVELESSNGHAAGCVSADRSAHERNRGEVRQLREKQLLEMVALGRSLAEVLDALCHFVEEQIAAECCCGVYLIDCCGRRLQTVAAPNLPMSFNDGVCALPVRSETGPFSKAAYLKAQVIVVDMESDPLWEFTPFHQLAAAHGQRSCWSTPIVSLRDGRVFGTIAVLHHVPASPTHAQLDLIANATRIASIAVERAQRDVALKRSEAFLLEAQKLSSTGSFSWQVATDEITSSEQLGRIFEFVREVPVTLTAIRARVHPQDWPSLDEMLSAARAHGADIDYEHRLLMPDHSVKYVYTWARGIRDEAGDLEYIGAVQDVTRRRIAEEALGNARAELERVARDMSVTAATASIAHEVNQPICGVVTNANICLRMLSADAPDVEAARETARRTLRDGSRAAEVVSRLRALFGKQAAKSESIDLNEATREMIALSLTELQRNRVILRSELAEDLPTVIGDRVQLQQVILNLLLNASDAVTGIEERSRCLLIRTEREQEGRVRLSVKDAGIGLEAQVAARLFEPFNTTKERGMGIGLFVSRTIIERHCGCLQVSPNDGPGMTFSFSIPAALAAIPMGKACAQSSDGCGPSGLAGLAPAMACLDGYGPSCLGDGEAGGLVTRVEVL
jgi:signal transduction histidine kinase